MGDGPEGNGSSIDGAGKSSEAYLDAINGHAAEKAGAASDLNPHRRRLLEIGPGGGSTLLAMVRRVENVVAIDQYPEIIVLDLLQEVLNGVRAIIGATEVPLEFIRANAVEPLPFSDSSITNVNLSAILHELFSYEGGTVAIDTFASEISRVMTTGGVLAYRDPNGLELHNEHEISVNTTLAKLFLVFFLKKFLDSSMTKIKKPELDYEQALIYLDDNALSIDDFYKSPYRILDAKSVRIVAKHGLIKEFERHFIVFTKSFAEEMYFTEEPESFDCSKIIFSKEGGLQIFKDYLEQEGVELAFDGLSCVVPNGIWGDFLITTERKFKFLRRPVKVTVEDKGKVTAVLEQYPISYTFEDGQLVMALEDFNLYYPALLEQCPEIAEALDADIAKAITWGLREGEEHYFYGSAEEVIARFANNSIVADPSSAVGFSCLCPASASDNRTVERFHYSTFIQNHITDDSEHSKDKKRTIKFVKMPIEQAFPVLCEIYKKDGSTDLGEVIEKMSGILLGFEEAQRQLELDSRRLRALVEAAAGRNIIEVLEQNEIAVIGTTVELTLINKATQMETERTITIGAFGESLPKRHLVSYSAPIAKAVLGKEEGAEVKDVRIGDGVYDVYVEEIHPPSYRYNELVLLLDHE